MHDVTGLKARFETMAFSMYCLVSALLLTSQLCCLEAMTELSSSLTPNDKAEVHIVYMGRASETTRTPSHYADVHMDMLTKTLGSVESAAISILYSYKSGFNGFAAVLTQNHAESIRGMDGVVSVFRSETKKLHTTESWEFLGLSPTEGIWPQSDFGNGTIVGLLDSGIWPESQSFNDDGFGPIPARWKGSCETGENFTKADCNKKLIGAKYFYKGFLAMNFTISATNYKSARDAQGHGTHTSSTATGRRVANASFDGLANGTASGGAPSARVAMYKVCWPGCTDADILAGFDAAISDGVDILSVSLAGHPKDYQLDSIAIGSFHAVAKGILVACAAGNDGPNPGSVTNLAPWIFTVAASTINRVFQPTVDLDGGPSVPGIAVNTFTMNSTFPIVNAADIPLDGRPSSSISCTEHSLDSTKTVGKIIVCQDPENPFIDVYLAALGAVGFVSITPDDQTVQIVRPTLPTAYVNANTSSDEIYKFLKSTSNPKAIITKSVSIFNTTPAPVMAYFSSQGPPSITPNIMKPDITAPGVEILAAWAPVANPGEELQDIRVTDWNIDSGTSMACPHVAGTAAIVKSVHPSWGPGAIKSAIMTTATPINTSIPANSVLAAGAGQINPSKAVDPGLVFNTSTTDYVNFLCAIGYNSTQVQLVSGGNERCPKHPPRILDMNHPSIYVSSNITVGSVHNAKRTVTNVGPSSGPTQYWATLNAPEGVDVEIDPTSLDFSDIHDEQSFSVSVTIKHTIQSSNFGSITWNDANNTHSVTMLVGAGGFGES